MFADTLPYFIKRKSGNEQISSLLFETASKILNLQLKNCLKILGAVFILTNLEWPILQTLYFRYP